MDILRLLEQLDDMVVQRPKTLLVGPLTWGLNKDEVSMQIAKIRASLPAELKQAVAKVRESERIVDSAREDADKTTEQARREAQRLVEEAHKEVERMMESARVQQERMVNDSEILRIAKAQADEIRNMADRDAVHMRRSSEKYAYDVLSQLENVAGKVMTAIERGKQDLDRPAPEAIAANSTPRERIKVQ